MSNLQELKKVFRGLLISSRDGMLLRHFKNCYKKSEGSDIPLFGYSSLVTLLNSISDTVYTVRNKSTSEFREKKNLKRIKNSENRFFENQFKNHE